MKINWYKSFLAGIIGTLMFDIVGYLFTGNWWDIPALLSGKLDIPFVGGLFAHYSNGVILAVIYAAIAPSLWGPKSVRALTFVTIQTIFGVWLFMLPLLGAGIAGLGMGPMVPLITLLRHWAFGVALFTLTQTSTSRQRAPGYLDTQLEA